MYYSIYAETDGVASLLDEAGEYDPAYAVQDPEVKQEANKSGSLEFTIHPQHPYFDRFIKMRTKCWVIQDGICIFYGRVLYTQMQMSGAKKVYCEGALSFLLDSLVTSERALLLQQVLGTRDPAVINVRDYTKFDLTVRDFFTLLIYLHNSQVINTNGTVPNEKTFVIGDISSIGTSDRYNFEISGSENSADFILDELVDKVGGYLTVRPVFAAGSATPTLYIDWKTLPDTTENLQTIEFGKNLITFSSDESGAELFTVFVPTGKPSDSSDSDKHLYDIENWTDDPVEAKDRVQHFYFNSRTGVKYLESVGGEDEEEVQIVVNKTARVGEMRILTGIEKYGVIYKAYDIENVNAADSLYDLSVENMIKKYDPKPEQVTVTALDLYKAGYYDQAPIRFGAYLTVQSGPHGLDRTMLCCQIDHKLRSPESTSYTLTSDLNEKGDGVPVFSKETSKKTSSSGSGGSSYGSTLSGTTTSTSTTLQDFQKSMMNTNTLLYSTTNNFRMLANSIGFAVQDGQGTSSEIDMLKNAVVIRVDGKDGAESGDVYLRTVVDTMMDHIGLTALRDSEGIPEVSTDPNGYLAAIGAQIQISADEITSVVRQTGVIAGVAEFNRANAYAVGAYVSHEGATYRFTSTHTAGTDWSASEVTLVSSLSSRVSQTQDSWSATVSAIGSNGAITAGSIALAITNSESSVTISADHIAMTGNVTLDGAMEINESGYLYVKRLLLIKGSTTDRQVSVNNGTISTKDVAIGSGGALTFVGTQTGEYYNLTASKVSEILGGLLDVQISGPTNDTYTLQVKKYGDTTWTDAGTFSRATTLTGAWASGTYTVSASPQGDTISTTPALRLNGLGTDNFTAELLQSETDQNVQKSVTGYLAMSGSGTSAAANVYTGRTGSAGSYTYSGLVASLSVGSLYTEGVNAAKPVTIATPTWQKSGVGNVDGTNLLTISASSAGGGSDTEYVSLSLTADSWLSDKTRKVKLFNGATEIGLYTVDATGIYEASEVSLTATAAGAPTYNSTAQRWYSTVDVTKTLGATTDTESLTVDVQAPYTAGAASVTVGNPTAAVASATAETTTTTITATGSNGASGSSTLSLTTSSYTDSSSVTHKAVQASIGGNLVAMKNVDSVWNAGARTAWLSQVSAAGSNHQGTLASNTYYCPRYQDANGNIQTLSNYTWLTPTSSSTSHSVTATSLGTFSSRSGTGGMDEAAADDNNGTTPSIVSLGSNGGSSYMLIRVRCGTSKKYYFVH